MHGQPRYRQSHRQSNASVESYLLQNIIIGLHVRLKIVPSFFLAPVQLQPSLLERYWGILSATRRHLSQILNHFYSLQDHIICKTPSTPWTHLEILFMKVIKWIIEKRRPGGLQIAIYFSLSKPCSLWMHRRQMDHNHRSIEDNQTKSLSVLEGTLFVN